jgi:excisionase family DNA binding protein
MCIGDLASHPARYVTVQELATYLETTRRQVYNWIDKGALPAVKHGKLVRILTSEARRFANTPARTFSDTSRATTQPPVHTVPGTH